MTPNSYDRRVTTPAPRPFMFPIVPLLCLIPVAWLSASWSFGRVTRWLRRRPAKPVASSRALSVVAVLPDLYDRPRHRTPAHSA